MRPLAVFAPGKQSRLFAPLLAAVTSFHIDVEPYVVDPRRRWRRALDGLAPLDFVGALVEGRQFQARALTLADSATQAAQSAGAADILAVRWGQVEADFIQARALQEMLAHFLPYQARLGWIGEAAPELKQDLALTSDLAEAEVWIYPGGEFPLLQLEPYHYLVALAEPPPEVFGLAAGVLSSKYFIQFQLHLALRQLLGLGLPLEAFLVD